jgi:hypothetical protein
VNIPADAAPVIEFEAHLERLELDANTLRRDPLGRTWLPEWAGQLCARNERCRARLAEFVADQRALYAEADLGPDPFFAARVLGALPEPLRFTGLTPRRRVAVLGTFYGLASGVGVFVFGWLQPAVLSDVAARAHDVVELGSGFPGGMVGTMVTLAIVVLAVALTYRAGTTSGF